MIGARLNSSRLPSKHLLDLAGKPLIARVFERVERIIEIDRLVLATTGDASNRPLVEWAEANSKAVFAYQGDVNDLVGRVDALVQAEQPDVVIYFCGDSPLIEPETVSRLIRGLQSHPSVGLIELEPLPDGSRYIHEGFSVYRRSVWDRIVVEAKQPEEREHVGVSLRRFREQLTTASVPEDPVFSCMEHRISIDTPSDYQFMFEVYRRWYATHAADTVIALPWVIEQLRQDSGLASINAHVRQKAVGDISISALIVCHAGAGIGLGHLARSITVARALQDKAFAGVRLLIQGDKVTNKDLALIPHRYISLQDQLSTEIRREVHAKRADVVIFDIHPQRIPQDLSLLLAELSADSARLVAIDGLVDYCNEFDLTVVPSFFVDPKRIVNCHRTLIHGWDCCLLDKLGPRKSWSTGDKVLVLTGGSDATHLGRDLPQKLDNVLPVGTEVHWVRGPYAEQIQLPVGRRLRWVVHEAPERLGELMAQTNYALTVYGVSFYELLQYGIPTVVFSPYGGKDQPELKRLQEENVAVVAADDRSAVAALRDLMCNPAAAESIARCASAKIDGLGPWRLAERVRMLVNPE